MLRLQRILVAAATRYALAERLRASPSLVLHNRPTRPIPLASALLPDSGSAGVIPPSSPSAPAPARAPASILEPNRLVSALEKLAAAGHTPEPHWLDMFLAACQPVLPQLSLGQLAALARSLDRLGVEVPLQWTQALVQASYDALPAAARAGDVADLLRWLAADGRLVPEPSWVGTALQQIQVLFRSRPADLTAGQAADVAWAVAHMGYRPADSLLDSLAAATMGPYAPYNSGGGGDEGGSEEDVWGREAGEERFAGLGPGGQAAAAPPSLYGVGGSAAGGGSLATLPPAQLSRLAWAFASYNYFPSDPWVRLYLLEGIWCRGLSPEEATAVLWSLGAMQLPTEDMWLRNYYLLTTGRLHEVPPEGLVNAMWALAACREVERAAPPRQRRRQRPPQPPSQPAPGSDPTLGAPASTSAASAGVSAGVNAGGAAVDSIAMQASAVRQRAAQLTAAEEEDADGGGRGSDNDAMAVGETEEDQETYDRVAAALEGQLAALARLRESGSPRQRQALEQLEAALQRRLARERPDSIGGDGDIDVKAGSRSSSSDGGGTASAGDDDSSEGVGGSGVGGVDGGVEEDVEAYLPAAWAAEWYGATLPYLRHLDKTLLVKALWAAACLELRPPPAWLSQLAAAATAVLLAEGVAEPLELLYASRSADGLLLVRRRRAPAAAVAAGAGAGKGLVAKEEEEDEEEEEQAREALASFAAESFERLSRQQLPASWRRLNPRFPPYTQPRPGALGPGAANAGNGGG